MIGARYQRRQAAIMGMARIGSSQDRAWPATVLTAKRISGTWENVPPGNDQDRRIRDPRVQPCPGSSEVADGAASSRRSALSPTLTPDP